MPSTAACCSSTVKCGSFVASPPLRPARDEWFGPVGSPKPDADEGRLMAAKGRPRWGTELPGAGCPNVPDAMPPSLQPAKTDGVDQILTRTAGYSRCINGGSAIVMPTPTKSVRSARPAIQVAGERTPDSRVLAGTSHSTLRPKFAFQHRPPERLPQAAGFQLPARMDGRSDTDQYWDRTQLRSPSAQRSPRHRRPRYRGTLPSRVLRRARMAGSGGSVEREVPATSGRPTMSAFVK